MALAARALATDLRQETLAEIDVALRRGDEFAIKGLPRGTGKPRENLSWILVGYDVASGAPASQSFSGSVS